jgi:hypothetical protein
MKTIDLGKKRGEPIAVEVLDSTTKDDTYYPSLYLSDRASLDDAPDAGEEGTATIKYRVVSKTENERKTDSGVEESYSVDLEIMSITFDGKSKKSDMDMIEEGLSENEESEEEEED